MNIFSKNIFSPFIKKRLETRQDKFESILEIIESVVSSPFFKTEADSDIICCTMFETVCVSSLAMCAYHFPAISTCTVNKQIPFSVSVRADPTCFLDK